MSRIAMCLLTVVAMTTGQAFAQKIASSVVARKPSLTCPQTELGDTELQARYTAMWERFASDVEKASDKLQEEIGRQSKSAIASGNLDLALFWQGIGKECEQKGELRWDEPSLKKTWNDRFGQAKFPTDFSVVVKKVSEAYLSARTNLEKGYGELVADFTKAEKLEEAVKIRSEIKELLAEKGSAPEPAPQPKPEAIADAKPKNGKYRFVFDDTGWGFLLELQDDTLLIHGDVNPNKPGGIAVWPNPRSMPCRIVDGKVFVDDKGTETIQWRCAITWDSKTGEATHLFDNYKGKSFQKRGKITAGSW